MPKKKKGAKKGGAKAAKKKDHPLTDMERFVSFQCARPRPRTLSVSPHALAGLACMHACTAVACGRIATRTDALRAWQTQRGQLLQDGVAAERLLATARERCAAALSEVRAVAATSVRASCLPRSLPACLTHTFALSNSLTHQHSRAAGLG
jgi:hypothetical protein